jgi:ParB family chromosome partitioning protein
MKTALGKGLSALIPEKQQPEVKANEILDLDINAIVPNEYQPRKVFNDASLNELISSIKEKGVIQPIIVRKASGTSYELIAGERRWRASTAAGLKTVPVIVKDAAPVEALELALIENIQREDLNPLETAEAFQRLIDDFEMTHEEMSQKVGKDRATVTNYLRILKLSSDVKRWIAEGSLTIGHAKALLQIENSNLQINVARKVIHDGLSVRATEALCKKSLAGPSRPKAKPMKDPQVASLEEKLIQSLGTKVHLIHKSNKKGGRIEIEYYSLEELDRLLEILMP